MRKILAVFIAFLVMAIPLGILWYVFSKGIVYFFSKETLVVIIFALALFFLIRDILKRIKKIE